METKQKEKSGAGSRTAKAASALTSGQPRTTRKANPSQKPAQRSRKVPSAGSRSKARPAATRKTATSIADQKTARAKPVRERRTPGKTQNTRGAAQKKEPSQIAADIVYLPPKPFSRNRLLLRLATVTAFVVALLLGISVFFKVEKVVVSGTDKYTAWDVSQAADITGDNLLTFSRAKASGKIQLALPYVQSVRIGIKLPDTVNIYIEEIEITYAVKDQDNGWWLISSGGKVLEKAPVGAEEGYTRLLGIQLEQPVAGQQAKALEPVPQETGEDGNPIPVTVTGAQRLQTALDIVDYLEQYGIIGKAASVDVSDIGKIQLWYEKRYLADLGDDSQLGYKIKMLKSFVDSSGKYESGKLDISFTVEPNRIIFDRFDES